MPLLKKSRHDPEDVPEGLHPQEKVYTVRYTGEIFREYEDYLKAVASYRQRIWSCKLTGKAGLSYEEALACEKDGRSLARKMPEAYLQMVAAEAHWSMGRADDVCIKVLAKMRDKFLPGEEANAAFQGDNGEGQLLPCRIISEAMLANNGSLGRMYEVEWLGGPEPNTFGTLPAEAIQRPRLPFARSVLRAWLDVHTSEEPLKPPGKGQKAVTSLWRLKPGMAQKLDLDTLPPEDIVQAVEKVVGTGAKVGKRGTRLPPDPAVLAKRAREAEEQAARAREEAAMLAKRQRMLMEQQEDPESDTEVEMAVAVDPRKAQDPGLLPRLGIQMDPLLGDRMMDLTAQPADEKSLEPELLERFQAMLPNEEPQEEVIQRPTIEPLEETEARLQPGTVKHAIFVVLMEAGPQGLSITEIMDTTQAAGLKEWGEMKTAKNSIASTCVHDVAFARIAKGRFAVRALPGVADAEASVKGSAAVMSTAARAVAQVEQNAMKAITTLMDRIREDAASPKDNRTKCYVCLLSGPRKGDPLLLCDICQSSQHLGCYAGGTMSLEDLPDGDWHCERCDERKENIIKRLEDMQAKKIEALEKIAAVEHERIEKAQRTLKDKQEKDRLRQEREQRKQEEKAEKERLKEEEKKRVNIEKKRPRYPKDDAKVLIEEQTVLAHLEVLSKLSEEELQQHPPPKLDDNDDEGLSLAVVNAVRTWRKLPQDARADLIEVTKRRVEGPPEVAEPLEIDLPKTYADAAAICEFMCRFSLLIESRPPGFAELRQAAMYPLDSGLLPDCYLCLLRVLLLDFLAPDHVLKSRARRWARVFDEITWPDVLRRYFITTRAHLAQLPDLEATTPQEMASLDNDQAALLAGVLLGRKEFHELPAELHIRILSVLVDDVLCTSALRLEIERRTETVNAINSEWQWSELEERKAAKAEDDIRKEEAKAIKEELAGKIEEIEDMAAKAGNAPKEAPPMDLPPELQQYTGAEGDETAYSRWQRKRNARMEQLQKNWAAWEAQQKRHEDENREWLEKQIREVTAESEQRDLEAKAALEEDKSQRAADREARQELHRQSLASVAIRFDPLGSDRTGRRYFWLEAAEPGVVFVESQEGAALGCVADPSIARELSDSLNPKGIREKTLAVGLRRVCNSLTPEAWPEPMLKLPAPPARRSCTGYRRGTKEAVILTAMQKVEQMISELISYAEAHHLEEHEQRFQAIQATPTVEALCDALFLLESAMGTLGNGLPKNADDASLEGTVVEELLGPEFDLVPKDVQADLVGEAQADATDVDSNADKSERKGAMTGEMSGAGEGAVCKSEAAENGAEAASGTVKEEGEEGEDEAEANADDEDGDADDDAEDDGDDYYGDDDGEEDGEEGDSSKKETVKKGRGRKKGTGITPLFKRSTRKKLPTGPDVYLPDEMELSDGDNLTSHTNHGRTIWRTGRERMVWLRDVTRARKTDHPGLAAFATVAFIDRTAPFLKKRSVGRRGATIYEERTLRAWALESRQQCLAKGQEPLPVLLRSKVARLAPPRKSSKASGPRPPPVPQLAECEACAGGEGPLLKCSGSGCIVTMHPECAGLQEAPVGDWFCTDCAIPAYAGRGRSRARGRGRLGSSGGRAGRVKGRGKGRGKGVRQDDVSADLDDEDELDMVPVMTNSGRLTSRLKGA